MNGAPPYSEEEAESNGININVNDLSGPVLAHDGRAQFYQAFLKPGNYFKCTTDAGPVHKKQKYSTIVTKEMNRIMKRSLPYYECFRSKFASVVLHGIAPSVFRDSDHWCPEPFGVEDVMVPANTLLTMANLPFFAVYRSFTAPELIKLTRGPKVAKGWNQKLAERCIAYVDKQSMSLMSNNWPQMWSPEKAQERIKGDGGFYAGDACPTIDCWDFYFWNDDDKAQGWNRRMVLDAWSSPSADGTVTRNTDDIFTGKDGKGEFLYNPGKQKWADSREQIVNWQFADLSAVAPFRYHSVRSLGFLLYAVCHLQNRMRCKFNEMAFEQAMQLFRVKSQDDMQRALKVDMFNRGFIDESLDLVKAQDRYQGDARLMELALNENRQLINQNASSYTANPNGVRDRQEKTATQFVGEMQSMTQLVSAGLLQAYEYQKPEYREIFRRFSRKHSIDPAVRTYQANCLAAGVPAKILYNPECWDQEPERVMGAGNKTLEMQVTQQLMQARNLYDPEPQRQILRSATLAWTDDAALADALVPEKPVQVTDSVHDAQLAAGVLMQGLPVALKTGMNHIEYVETLLSSMAAVIAPYMPKDNSGQQQAGPMPSMEQVVGLQNMAQHISQHIGVIAQDPNEKARVKQYGDQLGKLMNLVKAFAQRLQEQQQQQAAQGGDIDAETKAKIASMKVLAEAKAANTRESHAQRTAQRELQFEMEMKRKQAEFEAQLRQDLGLEKTAHEMKLAETETAHGMQLDEHGAALDAAKARHDAALKTAQATHDMSLKRLQAEQQRELERKQAEHKIELEKANAEHQRKLATKMAKTKEKSALK